MNKPNACICTYDNLFSEEAWGIEPEYITLTEWQKLMVKMSNEFWNESLKFRKRNSTPPTDAEIVEEQAFADRRI